MAFGACLIKDSDAPEIRALISRIELDLNIPSGLHFKNLNHRQKVYACKKLSQINAVFFATLSNKRSAERGSYLEYIEEEAWRYYNKNVQYLFELIGKYLHSNNIGINDHAFVFEEKRGVRYEEMKNLMRIISRNPIRDDVVNIQYINAGRIVAKPKEEEDLLKVADAIAHSAFQCCENHTLGITETRYLNELKNRFACCPEKKVLEHGIKAINYLPDLQIYPEDVSFLNNLRTA